MKKKIFGIEKLYPQGFIILPTVAINLEDKEFYIGWLLWVITIYY